MKEIGRLLGEEVLTYGIFLNQEQLKMFEEYYRLLQEWNKKINLTAVLECIPVIRKHFIDSLLYGLFLDWNKIHSLVDVGSGAGFPGIPLKIWNPSVNLVLVEAKRKKIDFLKEVQKQIGIKGIQFVNERVEKMGRSDEHREQYDAVTARGLARLNILCEYCLPLVRKGGLMLAGKGPNLENKEWEDGKNAAQKLGGILEKVEELSLPGNAGHRKVLIIKKVFHTLEKYPRKPGLPTKRPLT